MEGRAVGSDGDWLVAAPCLLPVFYALPLQVFTDVSTFSLVDSAKKCVKINLVDSTSHTTVESTMESG
eukprot:351627-Chlamydomonas_euryale.AAC.4